ncbi:MAG: 30S ribosomal protein S9 [Dehalococcoidia bacterium]|nr:30S ribosomal protein S9 [Dehalococcoidia bacterium]MDZ4245508.1 30S ribosomal protein S9 [Dehalococcoidia bacterium]
MKEQAYNYGLGRRKCAIARTRVSKGTGLININDKPLEQYFPDLVQQTTVLQPLVVTDNKDKFDITIKVVGGGTSSQAGAIRHGISRALVRGDESVKPVLRQHGFLTRDARVKERKKYGLKRARKAPQYTKR